MTISARRTNARDGRAGPSGFLARITDAGVSSGDDRPAAVSLAYASRDGMAQSLSRRGETRLAPFVRCVDRWLGMNPVPPLDTLLADTGFSRRHVERKCKALYGMSPKTLARKVRALRAAAAIARTADLRDDFLEYGFYDQPHMIREVKHFTGLTPGQIRARRSRPAAPSRASAGAAHARL